MAKRHEDVTINFFFTNDDKMYGAAWKAVQRWGTLAGRGEKVDWDALGDGLVQLSSRSGDDPLLQGTLKSVREKKPDKIAHNVSHILPRVVHGTTGLNGVFFPVEGSQQYQNGSTAYIVWALSTETSPVDLNIEIASGMTGQGRISLAAVSRVSRGKEGIYKLAKPISIPPKQTVYFNVEVTDVPPDEFSLVVGGVVAREPI